MGNSLDNSILLEASAAATVAGTPGQGPILWQNLGVVKFAILTGTGVPVDASPTWAAAGLVAGSRALYLREDGAAANTMMYWTADGGATWTAAAL